MLLSQSERDQMIGEFWQRVRTELIEKLRGPDDDADRGIAQYRQAIQRRGVGDLVYHQGVERTAQVVEGIIKNGLPEPGPE
jgi:hypothetical protein